MVKVTKMGYVTKDLAIPEKTDYDDPVGIRTSSSRGKPYRTNGDRFLERIRYLAFVAVRQFGWKIRGHFWQLGDNAIQTLKKPEYSDILPDDLYDAIALSSPRTSEYINPNTGTQVMVREDYIITDVLVSNKSDDSLKDKPKIKYSSYLPYICGTMPVSDGIGIIIKRYGYVVQAGMGSALSGNTITFRGQEVRINNDLFDPARIDNAGRTNIERMKDGSAPIGHDGKPVNLHHVDQTPDGPLQEMSRTNHSGNYGTLHENTGQSPSLIDRNEFGNFRSAYWQERAKYFDD